ncbi:MAG: hypothetical protein IJM62_00510 [Lachnospiraceae bacterium]|nr:hypothetical protein [Lachnospiraceae bacterium]
MKKLAALLIASAMMLSLAACAENKEKENMQIPNPLVKVEDAAAFEKLGIEMDAPEGAEEVVYTIISDEIADITFKTGGKEYTLRAAKTKEDISGLYGDVTETKQLDGAELTTIASGDETYCKIVWGDDIQYCLTNTDGAGEEAVIAVYNSIVGK